MSTAYAPASPSSGACAVKKLETLWTLLVVAREASPWCDAQLVNGARGGGRAGKGGGGGGGLWG